MDTLITGVQEVWAHGQWGTWVMGHMPIIMHISRWGTWALGCRGMGYGVMGYMGNVEMGNEYRGMGYRGMGYIGDEAHWQWGT